MSRLPVGNDCRNTCHDMWQMWQAPLITALITLIGLIAALIGDDWHDVLSWVALTVPVALIVWKWGCR